jgi:hypothetical protein
MRRLLLTLDQIQQSDAYAPSRASGPSRDATVAGALQVAFVPGETGEERKAYVH